MQSTTAYGHRRLTGPGRLRTELHRRQRTRAAGEAVFFELFDEDTAGLRPGVLAEPWPQERVQRHTMEHIADLVCCAPLVQTLDAPVPPTVEQLQDVLQFFDRLSAVPEPVIEVPKIITEDVLMRSVLRATQLAEQLVEVPTIISYSMISLLHALLEYRQRTVEQNVDIPAVGGSGTGGGLSGFLPGQNHSMTAEQIVDNPVPRRGFGEDLHGLLPGQSSSAFYGADHRVAAATAEQNVDIPVLHGSPHDFHQNPHPAAGSSDLLETANQGVFSTFHRRKKVQRSRAPRGRNWAPSRAHGLRELSWGLFGGTTWGAASSPCC